MSAVTGTRTHRAIRAVAATTSFHGACSPSAKPSAQAIPPLVVAIASNPATSKTRALIASQALASRRLMPLVKYARQVLIHNAFSDCGIAETRYSLAHTKKVDKPAIALSRETEVYYSDCPTERAQRS